MPWFRANMTAWLYEYAKKHMSKHGRISRTSERSGNEKAEMLKEDLERNVTLCLRLGYHLAADLVVSQA